MFQLGLLAVTLMAEVEERALSEVYVSEHSRVFSEKLYAEVLFRTFVDLSFKFRHSYRKQPTVFRIPFRDFSLAKKL